MSRQPLCQACLRAVRRAGALPMLDDSTTRIVKLQIRSLSSGPSSLPTPRKGATSRTLRQPDGRASRASRGIRGIRDVRDVRYTSDRSWTFIRLQSSTSRSASPSPNLTAAQEKAYQRLRPIIDALPGPVDWAVAYGSGVVHQANAAPGQPAPMTDFLLSTPSPSEFHGANLRQNPSHYPLYARFLGGRGVAWLQDSLGAGIWYVTMVHINGLEVKYGVISSARLRRDLEEWDTLYVAGRLQKPILPLLTPPDLVPSIHKNLHSTISLALLLLPPGAFSESLLWETVAGISYSGDPRMSMPGAENPEKVRNIVRGEGSVEGFRRLYRDVMREFRERGLAWAKGEEGVKPELDVKPERDSVKEWEWHGRGEGLLTQPSTPEHLAHLLSLLPSHLQRNILKHFRPTIAGSLVDRDVRAARKDAKAKSKTKTQAQAQAQSRDDSASGSTTKSHQDGQLEDWNKIAREDRVRELVLNEVRQIIRRPALTQSLKGFLTAGLVKSVRYAAAKFGKWWAGRRKRAS